MLSTSRRVLLGALTLAVISPIDASYSLPDSQVQKVLTNLNQNANKSWEIGTRAQALLEFQTESLSVLNTTSLPPSSTAPSSLADVLEIARTVVSQLPHTNGTVAAPVPQALVNGDGAAGDPASIGVAVLLANWTGQDDFNYAGAAANQLDFLLTKVPRVPNGALSHRVSQAQLWSDFCFMVPPFMAYYGVTTDNETLLTAAYDQIRLYRDVLLDKEKTGGLWKHIMLGNSTTDTPNDPGHWSTGNAWAAAGMLRVYNTIKESIYADGMSKQLANLTSWVGEIHDGMYSHTDKSGLFYNYADNTSTFLDASSTALLASTVYRLALLGGTHKHVAQAETARSALSTSFTNGSYAHFDANGWLTPVVNPDSYGAQGQRSPEGQAFVIMMQAAHADWQAAGSPGSSAASALLPRTLPWTIILAVSAAVVLLL